MCKSLGEHAIALGVGMPAENSIETSREIGNYVLHSMIAEGGMGAVYRARHRNGGEIVAVKIIPKETARNPLLVKRFEQEFRAASLIDHPNVVKAIEYCGSGPTPFLVMEYVEGESLGEKIEANGALPEELAITIITQVCDGLHRAHKQGLIHRDVKPDNILVTSENIAKLTDLGLVKDIEGELNLTKTGKGLGTPHFMSPEQFRNAKYADVRCDVYSVGATLYMMVTGIIPFSNTSPLECWMRKTKNELAAPKSLNRALSDRVDFAIRRAMAPNPADRPSSCREFMEDLTGLRWKPGLSSTQSSDSLPQLEEASTMWYMVYYTTDGKPHTVKGTTETIRANAMAGTLGEPSTILVSRTKAGPFAPLRKVPEFRDLVLSSSDSLGGSSGDRLTIPPNLTPTLGSLTASSNAQLRKSGQEASQETPTDLTHPTKRSVAETTTPLSRKSSQRLTSQEAQAEFLRELNEGTPNPSRRKDDVMSGKTDPLAMVPLTTESTVNMGTDERPALPLEHTAKYTQDELTSNNSSSKYFWLILSLLLGALLGIGAALIL